jgi:hypothetical protein
MATKADIGIVIQVRSVEDAFVGEHAVGARQASRAWARLSVMGFSPFDFVRPRARGRSRSTRSRAIN